MRPVYLSAPPVGIALVLLAIPSLIVLTMLGFFSKRAGEAIGELCGEGETIKGEKT